MVSPVQSSAENLRRNVKMASKEYWNLTVIQRKIVGHLKKYGFSKKEEIASDCGVSWKRIVINCGVLRKEGLVRKSGDYYGLTERGEELL